MVYIVYYDQSSLSIFETSIFEPHGFEILASNANANDAIADSERHRIGSV